MLAQTLLAETVDNFDSVFGPWRGNGRVWIEDHYQRTHQHPGPLLQVQRRDGRVLNARIIRPGDLIGTTTARAHSANKTSFRGNDDCLVEFLEVTPVANTELWPNGLPLGGRYYLGSLRGDSDNLRATGLTFHAQQPSDWALPGTEVARLLDWCDQQI